jgi:hypothetical protein
VALAASACHRVRYETRLPRGDQVQEKILDYWAFGIIGSHEVDLEALCPKGIHAWRTESVAWLDVLTLGIYTPRRLVVECAGVKR